jgi:hypothetical protein
MSCYLIGKLFKLSVQLVTTGNFLLIYNILCHTESRLLQQRNFHLKIYDSSNDKIWQEIEILVSTWSFMNAFNNKLVTVSPSHPTNQLTGQK